VNRVGPDGALYIVDFCNQAVIHNDTRGLAHGPAMRGASRPRPLLAASGRCSTEAKKLEVKLEKTMPLLIKVMETSPMCRKDARVCLAENRSRQRCRWSCKRGQVPAVGSKALRIYNAAEELNSLAMPACEITNRELCAARDDWSNRPSSEL
jgi:hypothetical protein